MTHPTLNVFDNSFFNQSVSQLDKTPCPTLKINSDADFTVRPTRKKHLARSRTHEKFTWYGADTWRNSIIQTVLCNQLQIKIEIHQPQYIIAMNDLYNSKDILFFEYLVLVCAMMRCGTSSKNAECIITNDDDFLEALQLTKKYLTTSPPKQSCPMNTKFLILQCIQTHFKHTSFNAKAIINYIKLGIESINNSFKELKQGNYISFVHRKKGGSVYKLNQA